jgi:hypothetical protein
MMLGTPAGILVSIWSGTVRYFGRTLEDTESVSGMGLPELEDLPAIRDINSPC